MRQKLQILMYSISLLFLSLQVKAKESVKDIWIDTAKATVYYDSSKIVLDTSITDKQFWLTILGKDTTVINYFRKETLTVGVYIQSINVCCGALIFWIKTAIIIDKKKDLLTQLKGWGYTYHIIKLIPLLKGNYAVDEIKFGGIEI